MKTLLMCGVLAIACAVNAQTVTLQPIPNGFEKKLGGYKPHMMPLTAVQPPQVSRLPDGISNAKFGLLSFGGKSFAFCVGDVAGKSNQLFVDWTGDGNLTDEHMIVWKKRSYGKGLTRYDGSVKINSMLSGSNEPVSIGVSELDPQDPQFPQLKDVLLYYADYGYSGEATLNGKKYPILLYDDNATGNFASRQGVRIMIDINGDGTFNMRGKNFDARLPFNVAGTTYELKNFSAAGGSITFLVSKKKVPEIPLPPGRSKKGS